MTEQSRDSRGKAQDSNAPGQGRASGNLESSAGGNLQGRAGGGETQAGGACEASNGGNGETREGGSLYPHQAPWNRAYPMGTASSGKPILDKAYNYTATRQVKETGLYPYYRALESAQAPELSYRGRRLIMMGSNNYLGLVNDPRVIEAAKRTADKYGTGCAGSRLLNGSLDIHEQLEARLAAFVGKQAAMVYSTGFQANVGALSALLTRKDTVLVDKFDHASIVDGTVLSRARVLRFRHNDVDHLAALLERMEPGASSMVVVDGVFSMEGDVAPLPEIAALCRRHGAALMVDDAHGLGVLGQGGRGTCVHFDVLEDVDLIMGTFSKSLASIGGFLAADECVIDYLKHNSRAMIFSASMPPPSVGAVLCALDIIESEPERIEKLWANTRYVRERLLAEGFDLGDSCTPIIPVHVGNDRMAFQMCHRLFEEGVFVNPVPGLSLEPSRALIRVSVMATHEEQHLAPAVESICKIGRELGLVGQNV